MPTVRQQCYLPLLIFMVWCMCQHWGVPLWKSFPWVNFISWGRLCVNIHTALTSQGRRHSEVTSRLTLGSSMVIPCPQKLTKVLVGHKERITPPAIIWDLQLKPCCHSPRNNAYSLWHCSVIVTPDLPNWFIECGGWYTSCASRKSVCFVSYSASWLMMNRTVESYTTCIRDFLLATCMLCDCLTWASLISAWMSHYS